MFAIAFDLVVAETEQHHPKGVTQAYSDIGSTLYLFGFNRVQGSLYVSENEDMANLFRAIDALKKLQNGPFFHVYQHLFPNWLSTRIPI